MIVLMRWAMTNSVRLQHMTRNVVTCGVLSMPNGTCSQGGKMKHCAALSGSRRPQCWWPCSQGNSNLWQHQCAGIAVAAINSMAARADRHVPQMSCLATAGGLPKLS